MTVWTCAPGQRLIAVHRLCSAAAQVMLHTSAPFQAGELQAQQEDLSKKLEAKKAEEAR